MQSTRSGPIAVTLGVRDSGEVIAALYTVLCTLHCTLYSVLCTVHCTLYTVHCTLYTVHCTLYTVHCTLYTTLYTLYNDSRVHHTRVRQPLVTGDTMTQWNHAQTGTAQGQLLDTLL